MKIWFKTYVGDKITNDTIVFRIGAPNRILFDEMLKEAVDKFDISTPVILKQHYKHFIDFNTLKFLPRDFVEPVDFDKLVLESVKE